VFKVLPLTVTFRFSCRHDELLLTMVRKSEVAAFSKWEYPHTPDPNAEDPETAIRKIPQPPGANEELIIEFLTKFARGRKKWLVAETHYCSYSLVYLICVFIFSQICKHIHMYVIAKRKF